MWDNLLGLHWLPLGNIKHSNVDRSDYNDISISLDSELCLHDNQIYGTQIPTGHKLLINARIDISATGNYFYFIYKFFWLSWIDKKNIGIFKTQKS